MGPTNGGGFPGTKPGTKAALSPARQQLVELMQDVNYGRIEALEVRDGEPVLEPRPRVLRVILLGKDNAAHAARASADFALKEKVTDLFAVFDRERVLTVKELVIDNGLPVRMTVADGARA
jgi:hypothetical protein